MIQEGSVVLFRFPQTDQSRGKLRPALVLRKLPGSYDDWLICMISTQMTQQVDGLDDQINESDQDFKASGLKTTSLFRVSRIAVVEESIFLGEMGSISKSRLSRIKTSLSDWIKS
jgi:mRNA interferase MazF